MEENKKSIGVFDSGLGGLTAVKELKKLLPNENIVYFGDTARIPYGTKSKETVYNYSIENINFLLKKNVKAIVIACGTASSIVDEKMNANTPVPLISVINPAAKAACNATKNKNVGIIATSSTINSDSYKKAIAKISDEYNVFAKACPLFVPLVENGYFSKNNEVAKLVAKDYLSYFDNKNIDTLILGCTHYPILQGIINDYFKSKVALIDSGKETIRTLKKVLEKNNLINNQKEKGKNEYFVSDAPKEFSKQGAIFLGENIDGCVKKVENQVNS